ncbi:hypothetical protein DAPPUDRAFT_307995 [Daphnia pulex]|uniref:Uncharacterized protein n=1 Tax=Daphnia pulex TaxID=6669 RepID=E9H5K8_DAPPU|nr:hypothetical protein DAPPUDRAFT_307995 [Daphnia pulex]|eukprot:EFX72983.1 hypothetical protein DAPPUDRAFT_307995 [Daphnia pulex]
MVKLFTMGSRRSSVFIFCRCLLFLHSPGFLRKLCFCSSSARDYQKLGCSKDLRSSLVDKRQDNLKLLRNGRKRNVMGRPVNY